MNRLHECLLEILLDIDVALTKSDIPYFVVGGSSIGHARNGKFIPWDDDIDLVFDDVYSDRVAESLMDNLSEKYIIEFPNSKENHRSYFRVVMRDTTLIRNPNEKHSLGISVELFPMVWVPDSGFARKWFFILMKGYIILNDMGNYVPTFARPVILGFKKAIRMILDRLSEKNECSCISSINGMFFHDIVPARIFGKPKRRLLEGHELPFPEHLEEYLECVYGPDYMTPPPIEKQKPTYIILDFEKGWAHHMDEARAIHKKGQ
ncbi:MAG: LicD family protein [Candidatus Methanomethylophilaceae archaeon]|nr:LicD family protein [Candidatus Methanomethylophilaceae archaeon]